jgi:hypothetical protein
METLRKQLHLPTVYWVNHYYYASNEREHWVYRHVYKIERVVKTVGTYSFQQTE